MSSGDFILASPPTSQRERALWLQNVAGFILFEDVRGYAIEGIDPGLDESGRSAALKAIDDALYGLMMVIDGVNRRSSQFRISGSSSNQSAPHEEGNAS